MRSPSLRIALGAAALAAGTALADASLPGAEIEHYDVQGADARSLAASMDARSGGHHGYATYQVSYRYDTRAGAGFCSVLSLSTALELKVRLPRWTPPPGASQELRKRFDGYLAALREHEDGHLQHGRDLERDFKRAVLDLSAGDCGALDAALRARFDALAARARERDREYDARTRHGATQGAVFK